METINPYEITQNLEFTNEDKKNVRMFAPIIEKYADEIGLKVLDVFAKDKRVLNIMQKANLSADGAKAAWAFAVKFIFSLEIDDNFMGRAKKIGLAHVTNNVEEDLVIEAMTVLLMKTLQKIQQVSKISSEQYSSLIRAFGFFLTLIITQYRKEIDMQHKALIKFMGISDKLLERQIEVGRKMPDK